MLNTHAQYLVGIRFKQKQGGPCFRRSKKASEEKKEQRVQPRTKQAQHLPIRHAGRPADFMVTQCHRQDPTVRFWFQHEFWKHAQGTNASSHVSVKKEASRMQSWFARVGMDRSFHTGCVRVPHHAPSRQKILRWDQQRRGIFFVPIKAGLFAVVNSIQSIILPSWI